MHAIHSRWQVLQVTDKQMEIFHHPDDQVANETMQGGIEMIGMESKDRLKKRRRMILDLGMSERGSPKAVHRSAV